METTRRLRVARRALALCLGSALAIALVEGAVRARLALGGHPFDGELAARRIEDSNRRIQGVEFVPVESGSEGNEHGMTLHPYLGYELRNVADKRDDVRAYWQSPEAAANFDVLVLGGSVAAGFILHWKEEFLPLLLEDARFDERKILVHWRTCAGHKQPQHALNLQWAFSLGDQPDLVLLIDGFNELAVAAQNADAGVHPLFPMWTEMEAGLTGPTWSARDYELIGDIALLRRGARDLAARTERYGLVHSAVLGGIVEREFRALASRADRTHAAWTELHASAQGARPELIGGPRYAKDEAAVRELSLEAWVQGSRTMNAACRARGVAFLHVLQPAARDVGS
ncbi:MAG TPA: hypothetical protein VM509_10925, partial [Planctomycetota bacterium]|nr:hypothetical protein [Planctomycetota bacterium]